MSGFGSARKARTNIYENEFLNLIIQKSKYFSDSLKKIDELYDYNIEKFRNNKCNLFWINFNINFNRFLIHTISTCKTIHYTTMKINGMISSDDDDVITHYSVTLKKLMFL